MKKLLSSFDLFPSLPILRASGQSQVVNLCGSLFSILIFSLFTYIFVQSMINIINLKEITATQITQINSNSTEKITNITIGVGLQLYRLTDMRSIFQVRAFTVDENMASTEISTFPCTRDMWANLSDTQYANLGIDYHMCIQRDGVQMYGEFGNSDMNMIMVGLYMCNNLTSPVVCATPADITTFFSTRLIMGRFLAASYVILDTGINPTDPNTYSYRVYQKTLWMLFNTQQQLIGQVFLGTYQIQTDTNFLPFKTGKNQKGYYVSQAITTTLVNVHNLPIFVQLYFIASPIKRVISRQYGKFDNVLSYVGGLYGIVISFIALFLASFNLYKYELRVAEGAFSHRDGHLAREQDMHFFKYLKYVMYDWIKKLTCCTPNWKDCQAIDEARQQAVQQIDVKHLLKRISHLQKSLGTVMPQQQQNILFMTQAYSLQQSRTRRSIVQYCQKFNQSQNSLTITTYTQINALLNFGLSLESPKKFSSSAVFPIDNTNNSINDLRQHQYEEMDGNGGGSGNKEGGNKEGDSLDVLEKYVGKYVSAYQIDQNSFKLTQEDIKIQAMLAENFYALQENVRIKYIYKIPLGILYRIKRYKDNKQDGRNRDISSLMIANQYQQPKKTLNSMQTLNPNPIMLAPLKNKRKGQKKQIELEYVDNQEINK